MKAPSYSAGKMGRAGTEARPTYVVPFEHFFCNTSRLHLPKHVERVDVDGNLYAARHLQWASRCDEAADEARLLRALASSFKQGLLAIVLRRAQLKRVAYRMRHRQHVAGRAVGDEPALRINHRQRRKLLQIVHGTHVPAG